MISGRILLFAVLGTGVLAALLSLAQLWVEPMDWDVYIKAMWSLLIIGGLASFMVAVDYDMPGSRRKIALFTVMILMAAAALAMLLQIWWQPFTGQFFVKTLISLAVLIGLCAFVMATVEDLGANKKLRDENFID